MLSLSSIYAETCSYYFSADILNDVVDCFLSHILSWWQKSIIFVNINKFILPSSVRLQYVGLEGRKSTTTILSKYIIL